MTDSDEPDLLELLDKAVGHLNSYGKMMAEGKKRDFHNRRDMEKGEAILELADNLDAMLRERGGE